MVTLNDFIINNYYFYEYDNDLYIGLYIIDKNNDNVIVDEYSFNPTYELGYLEVDKYTLDKIKIIECLGENFDIDTKLDFKLKYPEYFI